MGGSKKVTVGYWYRVLYHAGLCKGPIDKFLEFRGGDKRAWGEGVAGWPGELTASGTITIDAQNLWGGEKDQGGIAGDVDVMFGEADQVPNAYLLAQLGEQIPAWRGIATLVFKGGRYGAMNPYPRPASYKVKKIKAGWDNDDCWYPERACVWPPGELPEPISLDCPLGIATGTEILRTYGMHPTPVDNSGETYATLNVEDSLRGGFFDGYPVSTSDVFMVATNTDVDSTYRFTPYMSPVQKHCLEVRIMTPEKNEVGTYWPESFDSDGAYPYDDDIAAESGVTAYAASSPITLNGHTGYKLWYPMPVEGIGSPSSDVAGIHDFSVYQVDFEAGGCVFIYPDGPDMNPAHILYYSRTNSEMGREPIETINEESLLAAADWFFDHGVGFSTKRNPASESPVEFENRIARVAGCAFSRSLADGQWYIDIANGEYDIDALPILTDDAILEFKEQPFTLDNAINSVSVKYFDVKRKETITTAPVRALGLISEFGTIHQTYDYPEISNPGLAMLVAMRELLATATPTRAFELATNRTPYTWRANQYFRLQAPKRGIADMVCLVGEIETGSLRSGAIKLKAAQDIYSLPDTVYIEPEDGVDTRPDQTPVAIVEQRVIEAPYIDVVVTLSGVEMDALDDEAGFLLGVAVDPARSLDFTMRVAPDGDVVYGEVDTGAFCPTATVVEEADDLNETNFTLEDGVDLDKVELGTAVLWDDEICRVDDIDVDAGTIELGRGCADTVPALHSAGSRLWFYQTGAAVDETEYTAGETIDVKLLTNTGSRQLAEADATPMSLTFDQRQARPYPPANVKIDGVAYPASVSGTFVITWAHRNRVAQADQLMATTESSVTPADNTRYTLEFYDATDALIISRDDIGPGAATVVLNYTGDVTCKLWTVDGGGASLYQHEFTFAYTSGGSTSITATDYVPVDEGNIIDGGVIT